MWFEGFENERTCIVQSCVILYILNNASVITVSFHSLINKNCISSPKIQILILFSQKAVPNCIETIWDYLTINNILDVPIFLCINQLLIIYMCMYKTMFSIIYQRICLQWIRNHIIVFYFVLPKDIQRLYFDHIVQWLAFDKLQ